MHCANGFATEDGFSSAVHEMCTSVEKQPLVVLCVNHASLGHPLISLDIVQSTGTRRAVVKSERFMEWQRELSRYPILPFEGFKPAGFCIRVRE